MMLWLGYLDMKTEFERKMGLRKLKKRSKQRGKKGFEMSFAWIFAILAGAVILFIAIYATTKIIKTSKYESDTKLAQELSIVLDPLQTSFEVLKASKVQFSSETRLYDSCSLGGFGYQQIQLAVKSRVGDAWGQPGEENTIYNKYIFTGDLEQGKDMTVFSIPFKMPFKIADLQFLTAQKFCFIQPPSNIEDDLEVINSDNFKATNCSNESLKVCFGAGNCDVNVIGNCADCDNEYDAGYLVKGEEQFFYTKGLFYGALISSQEIYECNVKRLMARLVSLCDIYTDKGRIMAQRECESGLEPELSILKSYANSTLSSASLMNVRRAAQILETANNLDNCYLFEQNNEF